MGFPLIMYLSRSKTVSLWPEVGKQKSGFSMNDLKSSLSLSLNPKVDIVAQWSKADEAPPPVRDDNYHWPPYESEEIALSIEKELRSRHQVGTMEHFLKGELTYPCYKLSGFLTLDKEEQDAFSYRGITLNRHGITGSLSLTGSDVKVSLVLALENIAGIDPRDGEWDIWESGAMHMFGACERTPGFPVFGLFTVRGRSGENFCSCGIVYFAAYSEFGGFLSKEATNILKEGIHLWPERV